MLADSRNASTRYPEGRVCAFEGCQTRLSIYNRRPYCWQHDEPKGLPKWPRQAAARPSPRSRAALETRLRAAERRVERRVGEARRVLLDGKAAEAEVADLTDRGAVLDEVIAALNSYADQRQVD